MSAEVYGLSVGDFIVQNDFSASRSDKGGWTATQSFLAIKGSLNDTAFRNKFKDGTKLTELDPNADVYFERLQLQSADVQDAEGPYQKIAANFAGYAGSESNPQEAQPIVPVYSLKGGLRSRSIVEHPDVLALTEVQRGLVKDTITDEYVWDFTDSKLKMRNGDQTNAFIAVMKPTEIQPAGKAVTFCQLASHGIISYDSPTFFWRKTWQSEVGLLAADLNDLGKVSVPDGDPPEAGGTRDWRLVDASQENRGALFDNSLEWELSERGRWDSDLYDY
tara:strand:+ start:923 stop:1753 length:831 start_codon:yes stop_codon:yes gene_type:complete